MSKWSLMVHIYSSITEYFTPLSRVSILLNRAGFSITQFFLTLAQCTIICHYLLLQNTEKIFVANHDLRNENTWKTAAFKITLEQKKKKRTCTSTYWLPHWSRGQYCIVLYCFVLFWWGGYCFPMHCNLFKIYCVPLNLGITRTLICWLNFAQRPIFSGLRFFNEPEISDSEPPA